MRGKRTIQESDRVLIRLIPAHAGKTCLFQCLLQRSWAHPRACGENPAHSRVPTPVRGSSPRMRGKHNPVKIGLSQSGLIPAHAGKTVEPVGGGDHLRAHPRACGENLMGKYICENLPGSSPRMRGKRLVVGVPKVAVGLIPAHAGKTTVIQLKKPAAAAHPRACGENGLTLTRASDAVGSSPRMRGKRALLARPEGDCRLIPAHAGKTQINPTATCEWGAHPRACGENLKTSF